MRAQLSRSVCSSSTIRIRTCALASGPMGSRADISLASSRELGRLKSLCARGVDIGPFRVAFALLLRSIRASMSRPRSGADFRGMGTNARPTPSRQRPGRTNLHPLAAPHRTDLGHASTREAGGGVRCAVPDLLRGGEARALHRAVRKRNVVPIRERNVVPMTNSNLPTPRGTPLGAASVGVRPAVAELNFAEPDSGLDWRRVLSALLRYKWLVAAVTLVGTAAGIGATRFVDPEYAAQARIWIDVADRRGADRGPAPIRPGQLLDPEAWVDLLKSYVVLDQVVRDERLFVEPGSIGDARVLATLRDAAGRLAEALDVRTDMNGNFLRVELHGPDPTRITAVVNAVAKRYVAVAADLKRQKVSELTKILSQQVQQAQQNLQDAERGLETFRVQTITLPTDRPAPAPLGALGGAGSGVAAPGGRDPVFASFFDVQLEREQTQRDREALGRLLAQAGDSGLSADALAVIGSVQRSGELSQSLRELTSKRAELRALRYRYSDDYPPVQRLAGEIATLERQTIPALARALVGELGAREVELGRRLETDSRSLRQIPPRAIEEARLRRGVTLAENLYTSLQQRYEEAQLAEASAVPDVRILDAAVVPRLPVKNTAPRVVLLAF